MWWIYIEFVSKTVDVHFETITLTNSNLWHGRKCCVKDFLQEKYYMQHRFSIYNIVYNISILSRENKSLL